jgi:peptidoglycan/xylan/chitin deacetylase (PgdA/CDA1 family)
MRVSTEHFAEQLAVLQARAHPASLVELSEQIQSGQVQRKTVVLTFDDGYADLRLAQVLLERHQLPATVFVSPAYLGREFWWDELARTLLSPETLPDRFVLDVGGSSYTWAVEAPSQTSQKRTQFSPRRRLLQDLYRALLPLSFQERQEPIEQLRAWAGPGVDAEPQCRALEEVELTQLAESGLMDVGLHSMTHPVLAELTRRAQRAEIEQGQAHLQALLGKPITTFSYPNGSFSEETIALVKDAGFACACASQNGLAWHKRQLFCLPRVWVPNWDGATFSRWLRRWL